MAPHDGTAVVGGGGAETHQRQHLLSVKFVRRASDIFRLVPARHFGYSSHYYDTAENRRLLLIGKQVPSIAIICWAATSNKKENTHQAG
jgi:hypothetical protein